jgi:hypothetical protein
MGGMSGKRNGNGDVTDHCGQIAVEARLLERDRRPKGVQSRPWPSERLWARYL